MEREYSILAKVIQVGRTDGRTKGNAISPFRNFVATGDKKLKEKSKESWPRPNFTNYCIIIQLLIESTLNASILR